MQTRKTLLGFLAELPNGISLLIKPSSISFCKGRVRLVAGFPILEAISDNLVELPPRPNIPLQLQCRCTALITLLSISAWPCWSLKAKDRSGEIKELTIDGFTSRDIRLSEEIRL